MTEAAIRDILMTRSVPKDAKPWFRIENASVHRSDGADTTKVYIYDEIGYWGTAADEFVQQMMDIATPNIELHINSPGGGVFHGIAIYNALRSHPAQVSVYVDALAASAASFIAMAASPGKLYMAQGSTMMIHDGSAAVYGNQSDLLETAAVLGKLSDNIASLYAGRAGGTTEDWRALMKAETWYNASEAVDAGLADSIDGEAVDNPENKWDMSMFTYKSRDEAPSPVEIAARVRTANQGGTVTAPAAPTNEPAATAPAPPVVPAPPAAPVAPPAPVAAAPASEISFTLGGRAVSDPREVQNYIETLENFQTETVRAGRDAFVDSLASGQRPKVLASQTENLKKFAQSLNAEQFKDWQASWDAAPASSVLGTMAPGAGASAEDNNSGTFDAVADRIEVLKATIKQHEYANMSQEQIEKTNSWQELQRLQAQRTA